MLCPLVLADEICTVLVQGSEKRFILEERVHATEEGPFYGTLYSNGRQDNWSIWLIWDLLAENHNNWGYFNKPAYWSFAQPCICVDCREECDKLIGWGHWSRLRDCSARRGRHPVRVLGELQRLQVSRHDLVQAALVEVPEGKRKSSKGGVRLGE